MTIRQRLALGYAVITIPLTAFAAISFYMMESKVKSIGEFHAPALSSYQKLMSDAMEAVQESFAYVASGEEIERHDFLVWANGFSAEAAGFRSFTGMHNPGEETERALFDAIEVIQADLVKKAHLMFREYDTAGSISLSTFSDYEQTVDELSMLFKAFLEIERQEMSGAHRRATTTISHSQEIIIALGALSVILAFASGLFVVRSISESAGKMKDAMSKVAAGNLDVSLSVDSNDEFGKLADSFHRMTADLRDARSELRATLDYIDNILGSMNDSLVVVTPELRIQTVNQATCDLLGYSKDEIIGLPFTSIVSNGESRKLGLGNLYRLEEANLPEISYRSRDGRLIPVSFSGSLLRGKNGSLLGVVCVAQDLTERKQAEMREREMHAAMERAERMESIGSLAGGVAHDLNNMLGPLVAYPDMIIKHLPEDNPARRLVQRIGKTANEAADVIQDLLTLAGRGKYELRPTNLNDAISGYLISPSFIGLSEGHESVRVTTQLDESISKISGSPTHLMKIVMNLVVNAFQAMPNGGELSIGTS